jgi:hypothetical protein
MGWCETCWAGHRSCTTRVRRGFLGLVILVDLWLIASTWLLALVLTDPIQATVTRVVCMAYIPCSVLVPLLVGWRKHGSTGSWERALQAGAYAAFWLSFGASLVGGAATAM